MVLEVKEINFESEVLNSNIPVLVDFWAPWCGPCRMLWPVIENIANSYQGKAKIVKINVDDNPNLAIKYDVQSIPTVLIFNKWNLVDSMIWVRPITEYQSILDKLSWAQPTWDSTWTPAAATPVQNVFDVKGINEFQEKVKNTQWLVIVDFWAPWCGPCKVLKPSLEKIAWDNNSNVTLLKVNVDEPENQMLAHEYWVSWIPQVNFFRSWVQVEQFVGALPYEQVKTIVQDLIK